MLTAFGKGARGREAENVGDRAQTITRQRLQERWSSLKRECWQRLVPHRKKGCISFRMGEGDKGRYM